MIIELLRWAFKINLIGQTWDIVSAFQFFLHPSKFEAQIWSFEKHFLAEQFTIWETFNEVYALIKKRLEHVGQ